MDLPYLNVYRRHGGLRVAYYRRDGVRTLLRTPEGKPVDPANADAMVMAWQAIHARHEAADASAKVAADDRLLRPGSLAELIALYKRSPEWDEKRESTKGNYEKALRPLLRDGGFLSVRAMKRQDVTRIRNAYAWREAKDPSDPTKKIKVRNASHANSVVTVLSILLSHAVELGWREDNPALRPRRLKKKTEGFRAWTRDEFRQFWERSDEEWRFRALFALLTCQRGQDQVAILWSDYDQAHGRIHVVQEKGGHLVKLWIPAHPALKAELDFRREVALGKAPIAGEAKTVPVALTILARGGVPWPVNAYQKAAGKAIRTAGLEGVVWHGLRSTAQSWAAEGGASIKALMGLSGHKTPQMAMHYSRGADQENLAGQAISAIVLPFDVPKRRRQRPA